MPRTKKAPLKIFFDALQLGTMCGMNEPSMIPGDPYRLPGGVSPPHGLLVMPGASTRGEADGSQSRPFATVAAAVTASLDMSREGMRPGHYPLNTNFAQATSS